MKMPFLRVMSMLWWIHYVIVSGHADTCSNLDIRFPNLCINTFNAQGKTCEMYIVEVYIKYNYHVVMAIAGYCLLTTHKNEHGTFKKWRIRDYVNRRSDPFDSHYGLTTYGSAPCNTIHNKYPPRLISNVP